jgi:hypothetical protein
VATLMQGSHSDVPSHALGSVVFAADPISRKPQNMRLLWTKAQVPALSYHAPAKFFVERSIGSARRRRFYFLDCAATAVE